MFGCLLTRGNNMKLKGFYTDIKQSIEKHFSFLKAFGFSDFEEKQLAYELHFETKNNVVLIDIWFEATASTPIWMTINGYYVDHLEPENSKLKVYQIALKENYDKSFGQYLETNQTGFLNQIAEQYAVNGKEINDSYLKELSEIIKRNITVLSGNLEILKSNTEIIQKDFEAEKAKERIKNGTYTLEYQFLDTDDYDAYEEFNSLKELEKYLSEREEIKKYRILDCYMNEVSLE